MRISYIISPKGQISFVLPTNVPANYSKGEYLGEYPTCLVNLKDWDSLKILEMPKSVTAISFKSKSARIFFSLISEWIKLHLCNSFNPLIILLIIYSFFLMVIGFWNFSWNFLFKIAVERSQSNNFITNYISITYEVFWFIKKKKNFIKFSLLHLKLFINLIN